jgi:hypothetical protein
LPFLGNWYTTPEDGEYYSWLKRFRHILRFRVTGGGVFLKILVPRVLLKEVKNNGM